MARICSKCKKPNDNILSNGKYVSYCKKCRREYLKSRGKLTYQQKLIKKTTAEILFEKAKMRARKRGIEFTITVNDILVPEYCPVFGIKLVHNKNHPKDDSYSLDRLDPNKGYIPGNISVISHKANRLKNSSDIDDLEKVLIWLKANS